MDLDLRLLASSVDREVLGSCGAVPGVTHLCYLGRTILHVRSGQRLLDSRLFPLFSSAPKLPTSPWVPESTVVGPEHSTGRTELCAAGRPWVQLPCLTHQPCVKAESRPSVLHNPMKSTSLSHCRRKTIEARSKDFPQIRIQPVRTCDVTKHGSLAGG